ncbi:MAG: shufflon system plasmid conjugative transfer pilus tip adhesin PilV [Pseudomonadota bacterium]|jgi:hypothetical protein|uniref:shufflon system plasmid conjugative transfer pilus tip adhesin PilV n=1 Tax=Pseudomonas TaxID=286 RepID=UPI002389F6B9|nr:shufflon system plasmid conjugative transfer pilus tip adhesin PilV [Pseudomonas sp.]MDE1912168.1 shufflon system plasmid conjugative transfer pilus tip adhesin PilV [Pseudomonas sp.]MDE2193036.1 shufflon system plasmid conjugative transfer pilus tip adhesin PilV [Pseudomonas sp.]MDP9217927.1 shufflon system plasmid conjugative transfer pilus tip adhesin PilV [Pseudomonadota bacterium]MDQ3593627.1 shufflon system plasmid conjugative transfer pilus tip adhesin PilV [Pseudomonadota bacterium]
MTSKRKQRGFLSLDMAFGLIVFSVVVTMAIIWQIRQMDAQDYRIAADQQRTISEAQAKYLKDNFNAVLNNATATVPVQITVPMLINTHYLPAGFSSTNSFGQTILGLARKPNPNQLEAIVVTTGGQTIPEMGIRAIAENLGGPGGFISTTNPNIVQGVRGGWQVALSNYAIAPGPGHTASALFLMDGALANDYLYRNAVPNHPEYNAMNTDLGMGNHNINNVGSLTASGNVATGGDVTARNVTATANVNAVSANITGDTYTGGWFRTRGDTGWYSEKWGGGIYQNSPDWVQVYGNKNFSTGGEIRAGKLSSSGRTQVGEYLQLDGAAVEGNDCSPNGMWARDANGPLFCGEGKWKKPGGWEFQLIQGTCQAPYRGSVTCSLGDTTWKSCSLTGAFGVGDSEAGYIFRNTSGWYLSTSRLTWPGLFYWSCFK